METGVDLVSEGGAELSSIRPDMQYGIGKDHVLGSAPTDGQGFDSRSFRDALGHFATGVAVVSARSASGDSVGITVNSFSGVSLDPPLILFSIVRTSRGLTPLTGADAFAVNLLREDQRGISEQFAASRPDKWASVDHRIGRTGCPILSAAMAVFECRPYALHDGGDHVIIVGLVARFETDLESRPLVFFKGRHCALSSQGPAESWRLNW